MNQQMTYAFFDELEKIGQEKRQWADKEQLKRLAKYMGAIGGGALIGTAIGKGGAHFLKNRRFMQGRERLLRASKWAGPIVGALGMGLMTAKAIREWDRSKYYDRPDQKKRD